MMINDSHGPQYQAERGAKNPLTGCPPLSLGRVNQGSKADPPKDPCPPSPVPGVSSAPLTSHLVINFCNIRGLSSNFSSVEHHLVRAKPHILALTETQMSAAASTSPFKVSNYTLYPSFRSKGGLCVYSRVDFPLTRVHHLENSNFDVIWLKICLPSFTKFLCCLYRSPNSDDYNNLFNYLTTSIEQLVTSFPTAEVVLLGDFNVHHREWLGSNFTNHVGTATFEFATLNSLSQLIEGSTRIPDNSLQQPSPGPLDLFLTSHPGQYTINIKPPLGTSDHNLISTSCPMAHNPPSNSSNRRLWHFSSANWHDIRQFYHDFPWNDFVFRSRDPSECALLFTEVLVAGMEAYVPFSFAKSSSSCKPWFDRSCSEAIQSRDEAYQLWKSIPSPLNHANFLTARNRTSTVLDKAKRNFLKSKCQLLINNPSSRTFWSLSKQITNNFSNSSFPPLFKDESTVATTPSEKASVFLHKFATNSTLDDRAVPSPPSLPLTEPVIPNFHLSNGVIQLALEQLDVRKASGQDGIQPILLRECSHVLAPILSKLFRLILKTSIYPSSWKHAVVQPVPKKGDPADPSNYRPIAITSIISKVFESLINKRIQHHLETNNLISDRQYGFRPGRSCADLLAHVTHTFSDTVRRYGESVAVALDISKAFDRVWHSKLLSKLPSFGIPPNLCTLIKSFLTDRSISVRVDGHTSPSAPINSGVPQGSVLSPTLFLLFINDLLSCTNNPIHSYADDSTLHMSKVFDSAADSTQHLDESRRSVELSLSDDLKAITEWGDSNLVKFNSSKTQCTIFSLKQSNFNPHLQFSNSILSVDNELHMLGLSFSSDLSWKTHITQLAKSASQKLGVLYRFRNFFTSRQLFTLYVGTIRPCMEYCCHVWGRSPGVELLDRVESKAIRLIASPPLTDSLPSLSCRRDVASLALFYKYHFGHCSAELSRCVPPPLARPRATRQSVQSHSYAVQLQNSRIERYSRSFFPATSVLWNNLPQAVFPSQYNLQSFKCNINRLLRNNHSAP